MHARSGARAAPPGRGCTSAGGGRTGIRTALGFYLFIFLTEAVEEELEPDPFAVRFRLVLLTLALFLLVTEGLAAPHADR